MFNEERIKELLKEREGLDKKLQEIDQLGRNIQLRLLEINAILSEYKRYDKEPVPEVIENDTENNIEQGKHSDKE